MTTADIKIEDDSTEEVGTSLPIVSKWRSRRKRRILFGLAGILTAATIGFGFMASDLQTSLLAHAERISLPQIPSIANACWLDGNRVLLYGGRGLASSPLSVFDTHSHSVDVAVSQATQNACQPALNAQSGAIVSIKDGPITQGGIPIPGASIAGPSTHVTVWHDAHRFRQRKPSDYSFSVTPPANAESPFPITITLSPHRDCVAMMFEEKGASNFDKWVRRVFPSYHAVNSVYVCNVDGSNMRYLGSVPMYPVYLSRVGVLGNPIQHLSWMADSRRVSFLYNSALWTVPVD